MELVLQSNTNQNNFYSLTYKPNQSESWNYGLNYSLAFVLWDNERVKQNSALWHCIAHENLDFLVMGYKAYAFSGL